jgi:hypothetical protein
MKGDYDEDKSEYGPNEEEIINHFLLSINAENNL